MTTPAPQPPPPGQPPPGQPIPPGQPPEGTGALTEAAIVAAIAALLASATMPSIAALAALLVLAALIPGRRGKNTPRVSQAAAEATARLILSQPLPPTVPAGPAGRWMQRHNIIRRAQYALAAARRLTRAISANPTPEGVRKAVTGENRNFRAHLHATQRRTQAAADADAVAARHGSTDPTTGRPRVLVGWAAVMDDRTSAECKAAHGKNYLITQPPRIGLPGTVHPHCRCRTVPPWPTRRLVDGGTLPTTPTT